MLCGKSVLVLPPTLDNMDCKEFRVITYQYTRKVISDYNPLRTSENLIGYIVYWRYVTFYYYLLSQLLLFL